VTCRSSTTALPAPKLAAASGALSGFLRGLLSRRIPSAQVAASGPVKNTATTFPADRQMAALSTETIIHRRAIRMNNRNPQQVAAYVRLHTIMSKGA